EGGIDEGDVRVCLGVVAQQFAVHMVELLREKPQRAAEVKQGLEDPLALFDLPSQNVRVGQPESADQEDALSPADAVRGVVPVQKPGGRTGQFALNGRDR